MVDVEALYYGFASSLAALYAAYYLPYILFLAAKHVTVKYDRLVKTYWRLKGLVEELLSDAIIVIVSLLKIIITQAMIIIGMYTVFQAMAGRSSIGVNNIAIMLVPFALFFVTLLEPRFALSRMVISVYGEATHASADTMDELTPEAEMVISKTVESRESNFTTLRIESSGSKTVVRATILESDIIYVRENGECLVYLEIAYKTSKLSGIALCEIADDGCTSCITARDVDGRKHKVVIKSAVKPYTQTRYANDNLATIYCDVGNTTIQCLVPAITDGTQVSLGDDSSSSQ